MEQSLNDSSKSHYSFGDNRLEADRLEYLAAALASSSQRFLQGAKPDRVKLALDLGSGIGATTALVRDVTNAPRVVGYERSGNFLAIARRRYPNSRFETSTFCLRNTRIGKQISSTAASC
jgi:trans-aconitate 2-methyltransferase